MKKELLQQPAKIRFTMFLVPQIANALKSMPKKKRNQFVNEKLEQALERESLSQALEKFKKIKTSYEAGPEFIEQFRKEWTP